MFNGGGLHTLKGGYGFQRTVNDINSFYPGGYVFVFWDRSFTFGGANRGRGQYGYYEVNDRRITNRAGSNIHSLYIQDQWSVSDRLTLNLGIRTEDEKVPTFRPEFLETAIHFNFKDKLAPRRIRTSARRPHSRRTSAAGTRRIRSIPAARWTCR